MNLKPDITALLEKVTRHDRGLHERQLIYPRRDWIIGVLLAVVTVLGAGWWSAQIYLANRDIEVIDTTPSTGKVVYRAQLVEQALLQYQERAETFNRLLQAAPGSAPEVVVEPELESAPEPTASTTTEIIATPTTTEFVTEISETASSTE